MRILLALLAVGALAAPGFGANAQLVVMSTNPNGVPLVGTQYLLGVQVSGLSSPIFLGNNLITLTSSGGGLGRNTSVNGTFYNSPNVVFQTEADTANSIDPVNYKRTSDSYFASPWRSVLASPSGASETASTLFLDAGTYGAMPALVNNGTVPFAYVNVANASGVLITGSFALGTPLFPIGDGFGVKLTLGGQLNPQGFAADFAVKDNDVDTADFNKWKTSFAVNNGGDADADGDSDGSDFLVWQRQFGSVVVPASAAGATVPEPATGAMLAACALLGLAGRRYGRAK